eukprot:213604-Chlamydomonas_euryale.AAC.45
MQDVDVSGLCLDYAIADEGGGLKPVLSVLKASHTHYTLFPAPSPCMSDCGKRDSDSCQKADSHAMLESTMDDHG